MAATHRLACALLPLLAATSLWAQSAAPAAKVAPLELGGLSHFPAPSFAGNPLGGGCSIVRSSGERANEERRDCGAPRPPFRGQVFEWLETPTTISLFPAILAAGSAEPEPLLFGARGTVRLTAADPEAWVDLLQLDSFRASRLPRPDFRRRVPAAAAAAGVAMPAGTVVAIERGPRGLALSRPAKLDAGATLELAAAKPAAGRGDLLLVLRRPRNLRVYDPDHLVSPWLQRGQGEKRQPDQLLASGDRVLAFFYDLPAAVWHFGITSAAYQLEERSIDLRGGEASLTAFDLTPLPNLTAKLELPPALRNGPANIEVFDLASGERLTESSTIDPRSERVNLGFLPPVEVEVRLLADNWRFTEQADLRPQEDTEVRFAPRPIAVSGTVSRDARPLQTALTFPPGGPDRPEPTYTDAGGRYETVVFRPGFYRW